jgi:hypothetical protein
MHKSREFILLIILKCTRALNLRATTEMKIVWAEYSTTVPIRRDESRNVELSDVEIKKNLRNSTVQWRISPKHSLHHVLRNQIVTNPTHS